MLWQTGENIVYTTTSVQDVVNWYFPHLTVIHSLSVHFTKHNVQWSWQQYSQTHGKLDVLPADTTSHLLICTECRGVWQSKSCSVINV